MDLRAQLVTDGEPAEAIEPGQRALHHPAMPSESLARFDAPAGDPRDDAALAAGGATARGVVALVGIQLVRAPARPTASPPPLADRRSGTEQRPQHPRR